METGAAAEWQTPRVSLLFVCVFLPASVRASARVWIQMSACGSTFCPGLCVALPPDISSVACLLLWCQDKGGYCLPTSATWLWPPPPPPPPPPLPPPPSPCVSSAGPEPKYVPLRSLARRSLEMVERKICCHGWSSHTVCVHRRTAKKN